jgi:hypothetical protein
MKLSSRFRLLAFSALWPRARHPLHHRPVSMCQFSSHSAPLRMWGDGQDGRHPWRISAADSSVAGTSWARLPIQIQGGGT